MAVDVAQLLSFTVKNNASDLHLSGGVPPMIRVDGDIKRINMPALTHKDVNSMVYDIMNDKQRKDCGRGHATDQREPEAPVADAYAGRRTEGERHHAANGRARSHHDHGCHSCDHRLGSRTESAEQHPFDVL